MSNWTKVILENTTIYKRLSLAMNESTDVEMLSILIHDPVYFVRQRARENPACPEWLKVMAL